MSGFNWDDNDPLEGFDTDPTPSPSPPPPPRPAPKLPVAQPGPFQRPAAPAVLKPMINVEEAMEELEES